MIQKWWEKEREKTREQKKKNKLDRSGEDSCARVREFSEGLGAKPLENHLGILKYETEGPRVQVHRANC